MPYTQEISRQNKALFVFLLDQSGSMTEPLANASRSKADELALVINNWLFSAASRASGGGGVKDWMDIAVLGYRTDSNAVPIVGSAFGGALAGRDIVSIADVANNIARMKTETQKSADPDTGEEVESTIEVPVWIEPQAEYGTPMCTVLHMAYGLIEKWIADHPRSFPPILINISDGESSEGDTRPYADPIKTLSTDDGNVLVFNCHLSMTPADSFLFPHSGEILPDKEAKELFDTASELPEPIFKRAVNEGFDLKPGARGMVFNADLVCLIKFLDMGTRVGNLR